MNAPLPPNEAKRLAALRRYEILDTVPEAAFDDLTRMAVKLFGVPIALVSLVDESRQWFKSRVGVSQCETPRDQSFCAHALLSNEILEIRDATTDRRFADNPLVTGEMAIRFYAGAPLITREGFTLGTLCLIDVQPRTLNERERDLLKLLATQASVQLELRQKALELTRREEQLENAFEAAGLGVWDWNLDSMAATCSAQARTLLGLPQEDEPVLLESLRRLFVAEDLDLVRPEFLACIEGSKEHLRVELRGRVGGSRLRWFQIEGRTHTDADSGHRRMTGVLRDITAQKAREEVIRTSERHFRSYFEMPLVGFAETTPDTRWIEVNPRLCEMLGYTWEELKTKTWPEITHPEDLKADLVQFQEVMAGRSDGYSLEKRYIRKDGSILPAEISVRCLRRPDGSTEAFAAMVQDISERKAAERALRENESRLSLIFNNATDAMVLLRVEPGPEFRVVSANNRFVERMAQSTLRSAGGAIVGSTVEQLGPELFGSDATTGVATVKRLARIADGAPAETFGESIQGKEGPLSGETVLTPVPDSSGRCAFILYSSRDTTERERAKEQRDALEAQLRQAQKMEAIGTLAGGIAHDFNNILGAIMAYTDLALMDQGNPQAQKEDLGEILKASHRAKKLVEQILSFSRQQKQERRPVRLQPVIQEVLRLIRSTLPTSVALDVAIQPEAPTVLADPTQIHQILMNLSTNASHAMRGAGKLGVRLERILVDTAMAASVPDLRVGSYALLTLSDTGHGMEPQTLKRIFEPFFTTKPPGEGTGLGLSVVHGIVQEHEGAITVSSQPGLGTTFRLYLPEHHVSIEDPLGAAPGTPLGHGENILVVDDEPAICHAVGRMLQRIGYSVQLATSPWDGLELFRNDPGSFDAVITDLSMAGMTGPELAGQLLELRPNTPILLATGFSGTWNRESALEFGFRELLQKPVAFDTLATALQHCLEDEKTGNGPE